TPVVAAPAVAPSAASIAPQERAESAATAPHSPSVTVAPEVEIEAGLVPSARRGLPDAPPAVSPLLPGLPPDFRLGLVETPPDPAGARPPPRNSTGCHADGHARPASKSTTSDWKWWRRTKSRRRRADELQRFKLKQGGRLPALSFSRPAVVSSDYCRPIARA